MEFTIKEVAALLNGQVEGQDTDKINTISKIQEAEKGAISFLANLKYEKFLYETCASAVIVNKDYELKNSVSTTLIRVDDAYLAFTALLEEYQRLVALQKVGKEEPSYADTTAVVGKSPYLGAFSYLGKNVKIGDHCKVYPHVYIGDNVTIGDHTILYPGVKVMNDCKIGSFCTLQSSAIVGSDGFGFAPQTDGSYKSIPQVGNVILEDHVDIGSHTVIDRATTGSTVIEEGVKLDNLIQVAHNARIGRHTVIAAQSGVSGSTTIGPYSKIGGQVGFIGHIEVAKGTMIAAQSGIMKSVKKEDTTLFGSPAFDHKDFMKAFAIFRRLPDLRKQVEELERKLLG